MLILSRKCGESLIIDQTIEIKITDISGDKVRIGIEAPRDCKILRKELCQTVENNKQAASRTMTKDMIDFLVSIDHDHE